MFEERVTLAELEVAHGALSKTVYLQTTLLDDGMTGMKLVLTDGEDVWTGQISEDDLDQLSGRLKMDFKKFVSQSVSALSREGLQDISFEYQLKALPSERMQLVWKKCVASDDIKFQLGHVNLGKLASPSSLLCGMLSQCVSVISSLRKQIVDLEADNERLARDRTSAIKRLDKCVSAKAEVELDLFSKFVAILNSKKEKIRELEEEGPVRAPRAVSPVASTSKIDSPDVSSTTSNRNGQLASESKQSTSYAMDTDDESEDSPPKQARVSNSRVNLESSVNLGDEEEDETTVPVARRAKRKVPVKKPSVSKPVLPKVTSSQSLADRPGNAGRRSTLRKSNSGNSSSSVNTEDLLDRL